MALNLSFNTCLLIDDDKDDQEIFLLALKDMDNKVRCITANSGMEALRTLEGKNIPSVPDLIFLDLNMPCMDGKQCLIELKKIPALEKVPVIIYSTSSEQRDIAEAMRLGASAFLTKPTTISKLSEQLRLLFKNHSTLLLDVL